MSRLEDLIKKLCPNGVEFKTLGEVTRKNKFHQVGAAELEALVKQDCQNEVRLLPSSKNDDWWSDEATCRGLVCEGEVITLGRARYANLKYYKGKFVSSNNHIIQSGEGLLCRFLYHFIKQNYASFYVDSATYPKFEDSIFRSFQIPVPPLEVQQEIARILDKFATLEAELEAELEARRKQHIFYREKLLESNENTPYRVLGETCDITTGKLNVNAKDDEGKYPFFTCDLEPYRINTYAFDTTAILIAGNGYVGHVNYYSGKFNAYQRTYVLSDFKEWIYDKYLVHYLKAHLKPYLTKVSRKGSVPYITLPTLKDFPIPVPPLAEQKRIVEILDKFSTLIDDISSGLPAEIKMRHQQYEYYRDKLLTFTPAA